MSRINKVHSALITNVKGNIVRALVSTWDIVDFQGDRVRRGAFANSIADWETSGDKLPFLWAHEWSDPFAHLGVVTSMRETDRGLEIEAEILDDNEFAQQVKRLIGQRRVTQYSFAYDVVRENRLEDGSNELLELKLIECGPCLSGANPNTDTLSRKAVQQMLAREASGEPTWAGTSIPRRAVDDLRNKVSGVVESFLDDVYDRYAVPDAAPDERTMVLGTRSIDPEIERLNAEINKIADGNKANSGKASAPRGVDPGPAAPVLLTAVARLEQNAVRALGVGLVDEAALLMRSARDLRDIVAGSGGDVQGVVDACSPIVQALRTAGNPVAGDNLERALIELQGGTVNTDPPVVEERDRFAPKAVIDGRVDARFRPLIEPVAAVPVEGGETYRLPVVTTDSDSWRVEKEDTA
jgi:HK97 family phage prohead protease